jgi:sarcosine oxidase, subunit beta
MTAELADVIVVGGGIVGTSAAYHLAAAGAGRVLLLERASTVGTGSTGACAGGFRFQFSSRLNIELSLASVPMILGFTQEHGLPLDVVQDGYLFLLRDASEMEAFRGAADLQRSLGVQVHILTPQDVVKIVPGISLDGVLGASFCAEDGIADPAGLTQGYASLARGAGAVVLTGVEVSAVTATGGRVTGVQTAQGPIQAPVVIDAAGPWAGVLAASVGVVLPLEPVPRMVVTTGDFNGRPVRRTLVIDAGSSFYFHREGDGVLMGMGGRDEKASFSLDVDQRFIAEELLPTAVRVFPPLEEAGIASSWAGLYEMTPDRHPIIGHAPVAGLYLACGFSGHGFQHAPVVGKLLAELIVEGAARTVDISALSLDRFESGALVAEGHVV